MVLEGSMSYSLDMRSLPPSEFNIDEGLSTKGVPTMRLQKKEFFDSLKEELTVKTSASVRNIKTSRLRLSPPPHSVSSEQFCKWIRILDGIKCADLVVWWGYASNKYWILSSQVPRHEVTDHNRRLAFLDMLHTSVEKSFVTMWRT
ncbi:hypothetical protein R1sor_011509 [Riccia sorocarpa]|uniref:Uncharacterized protein n=1 Tax=Riccia sorocarpa TaxID=122646 RepID=A0ABD3I1G6_9MARC